VILLHLNKDRSLLEMTATLTVGTLFLYLKSIIISIILDLTIMRVSQSNAISPELLAESQKIGARLARLRIARHITQADAALRAGLSRNTAYRLEKGDPGLAIGQVLRYLDAIAPGKSLQNLLEENDPALAALSLRQRVRPMSKPERDALDF
jgi:DNA-binding XRE family transcriptional regulator